MRKDLDQMRLTAGEAAETSDGLRGYHDYEHSLGDELRGRRASMGKGLLDVQKELGIKPWIIVSIEKADPKSFDSPWMIGPLVKSYARYLGMNAEEAYARFKAEGNSATKTTSGIGKLPKLKVPTQMIGKSSATADLATLSNLGFSRFSGFSDNFKLSPKAIFSAIVVAGLFGCILYLGWAVYRDFQRISDGSDNNQFANAANSAVPVTTVTLTPRVKQEPPKDFDGGIGIAELNPDNHGVYVATDRDGSIGTELANVSGLSVDGGNLSAAEQIELEAPLVEEPARIAIVGISDVWVRVYSQFDANTVVKRGTLKAGEEFVVPMEGGPYLLRTGLSTNTYFRIGASVYGPVPEDGNSVVDGIVLTVEAISAAYPRIEKIEASDEVRLYVFAEE